MPIVGGIIMAGLLVGIVVALTRRADASPQLYGYGEQKYLPPSPVPSDGQTYMPETTDPYDLGDEKLDRPPTPKAKTALDAIEQRKKYGTPVAPEVFAEATQEALDNGMPKTAETFAKETDKTMTQVIPALVAAPDVTTEIPFDGRSGKGLWFVDVRGNTRMVIPNFKPQLAAFKALQKAIGGKTKPDGRIGPKTLDAFQAKMTMLGFDRFPRTVEALAANAVKWTEVLKKHFSPGQVGRPFDVPSRQWREFVARVNADWDQLAPVVKTKLGSHIGTVISGHAVTLSGLCGIVNRAGMRGAEKWLTTESDRAKYPATTRAFISTNGIF